MLLNTLALISLIIIIILLKRLVNIYPSLLACMMRWKENVNLEMSVKLSRDRNILAVALVIPFCITAFRFGLYSPSFLEGFNETVGLAITIGVFVAYILLRWILTAICRSKKSRKSAYSTSVAASRTFFIILTLLLMAIGGIMSFIGVDSKTIKDAMIWISGAIYLLFLLRRIQIFASSYNFFTVFLYLCALEIIPTGVLVTSAMIL
jgi:hypothetical protein